MTVSELIHLLQKYPDDTDVVVRLPYSKLYRWVDDTYMDINGRAVIMVEPGGGPVEGAMAFPIPKHRLDLMG